MVLKRGNVERVCDNAAKIEKLKAEGFLPIDKIEEKPKENILVEEMNLQELKALAKEKEINGYSVLNKEELIQVLKDVVK